MTCRLYIDEVGNADVDHPAEQYLSLTGIITKTRLHDKRFVPELEILKHDLFDHNPPAKTVILHRREIQRREGVFKVLNDPKKNQEWENRILSLIERLPYIALTVMIDKHAHRKKYTVWLFNPYHYCLRTMVERYVLWLNRHKLTGDVVVEPRFKKVDKSLKDSFAYIYRHGTENIPPHVIQRCITTRELKFEPKSANVAGLQFVDLIAHPSHYGTRALYAGHGMKPSFGTRIYRILEDKRYERDPVTRRIQGWGQKWLP